MIDMTDTIKAKSDQLNSDDLMAGPITVQIRDVTKKDGAGEQPISIFYQGDNNKPWKPCKSMRRVLVALWGKDGSAYIGRKLTLYRDEKVMWGGEPVGGIRISHMSHINQAITMPLTASRGSKKQVTVQPLKDATPAPVQGLPQLEFDAIKNALISAQNEAGLQDAYNQMKVSWKNLNADQRKDIQATYEVHKGRIETMTTPANGAWNHETMGDPPPDHQGTILDAG